MNIYPRYVAGFFLQLFPCALPSFLPFAERGLRFRRSRVFVGLVLLSALFPLVLPIGGAVHNL